MFGRGVNTFAVPLVLFCHFQQKQQHHYLDDMHIDATLTYVQIYGKLTKSAECSKITMCTKHIYFQTVLY